MYKININVGILAIAVFLTTLTSCEQENDELLTESEISLEEEFVEEKNLFAKGTCDTNNYAPIDAITGTDYNAKVNSKIDDRSCTYDYKQSKYGSSFNWGGYRLNSANNNSGKLQVRMERTTSKLNYSDGKYIQIKGTVRILNAGEVTDNHSDTSMSDNDGTYIAQVKGKHDKIIEGSESKDPAIALFIAKPKRRDGGKGSIIKENGQVKEFKIFSEQVKKRGGSGSSGRKLVYITTVKRNKDFFVDIKSRFETVNGIKRQYIDYTINGVSKSITVSVQNTAGQATDPVETRIRMGAYRCKGGKAEILWKDDLIVKKN